MSIEQHHYLRGNCRSQPNSTYSYRTACGADQPRRALRVVKARIRGNHLAHGRESSCDIVIYVYVAVQRSYAKDSSPANVTVVIERKAFDDQQ